jgi:hypothetical protein
MPFYEAFDAALCGEIRDSKTQIGLLKTYFWLNKNEI